MTILRAVLRRPDRLALWLVALIALLVAGWLLPEVVRTLAGGALVVSGFAVLAARAVIG